MKTPLKLACATALAAVLAAPPAIAQNESVPAPGQMMPEGRMTGGDMMGGDISGMQGMMGMMQMMQAMAPMMEACTKMMQAAAPQPMAPETTPQGG